ncbi:MAG TPA: hypothetical protein VMV94_02445, partial [Phycisphaerae bacterium]|nr:hypothetical protein [Phycisphaerae bacterium]
FSDFASGRHELVELQRDLADKGAITYKIPPEALDHELRFRVDARDRASNVGTAISFALQVVNEAATEKNESEKSEESSARDTKDKSSSAVDSVGDAAQGRGERHGGKAASKTPDLWYQEALSKITDLSDEKNGGAPPSSGVGRASAADQTPSPPAGEEESHADAGEGSVGEAAVQPEAEAKVDDARADESVARAAMPDRESSDAADESEATADEPEGQTELITPPVFALEEPGTPQSDESSALSTVTVSVLDPTHGNGLLVPLPATIEPQSPRTQFVTAHPWRILGGSLGKSVESIWALPKPRFALELYRTIEGRFLADRAMLRPVAMPGGPDQTFAGGGNPYAPPPAQLIEEP